MAISKRGKDKFTIDIHLGLNSEGKQIRKSLTFYGSKTEARAKERELKQQYLSGNLTQIKSVTFQDFTNLWLAEYACKKEPKTLHRYKELLELRITPSLGHIRLDKLLPMHIMKFINDLEKAPRLDGKEGTLSSTTVLHHFRLINTILNCAVQLGYISSNPANKIEKPKRIPKDILYFDEEQSQRFISILSGEDIMYQALITLMLETGARRGELLALGWDDIDFNACTVIINKSNQYIAGKGIFTKNPKTESSNRINTLSSTVIELLKVLKTSKSKDKLKLGDKWKNSKNIFTTCNGASMHPDTITRYLPKLIKRYNKSIEMDPSLNEEAKKNLYLPTITPHCLRHTSATLLINSGINTKTVSSRLGHKNISTTMDIYAKALKSSDKEASNRIEEILTPIIKKSSDAM